eukprot:8135951-Alexandrium_andersonii.AAC.1
MAPARYPNHDAPDFHAVSDRAANAALLRRARRAANAGRLLMPLERGAANAAHPQACHVHPERLELVGRARDAG